ncbi:lysosomal proton-coupled steroid conjugate and bile acid symporter SLC46A3-like [Macrobrachium rosenbergii]|uniref:lysosomal proton-coupled steroid conjugate and bile acid symporter SLC46A3-like n=1 Tax=Macrobrachium rosenbergii TaxID=79674 RepID=UPI0034D4ACC6
MARLLNAFKSISVEPVMLIDGACNQAMQLFVENVQMNKICSVNLGFSAQICENLADHPEENVLVQKEFSLFSFYNSILLSVPALIFVLFIGSWSDKYGRKIPLLLTLLSHMMYAAGYLLNNWQTSWPVEIIYLVTFLESLGGGNVGLLTSTTSYISDICPEKSRTSRLSIASSMWYLGGPLGTLIGAVIIKHASYNVALALVLLAYISVVGYVIFFIKESHGPFAKKELQSKGSLSSSTSEAPKEPVTISRMVKDLFNWRRVVESFKTALKKREGNTRCVLLIIIGSNMIRRVGRGFFMYMFVRQALQWDATDYGYWATYRNLLAALGTLFLIPLLTKLCDIKDTALVLMGSSSIVAEYVCYGLVMNKSLAFLLWLGPVAGLISNASIVAFRSLPTKLVGSDEKGRISAVTSAMNGLMPLVGYAIYSPVYYRTVDSFPSAQFFVGGSLNLSITVMFVFVQMMNVSSSHEKKDLESGLVKTNKKLVDVFKSRTAVTLRSLVRKFSGPVQQESATLESNQTPGKDNHAQAHEALKDAQEIGTPATKKSLTGVINHSFACDGEGSVCKSNFQTSTENSVSASTADETITQSNMSQETTVARGKDCTCHCENAENHSSLPPDNLCDLPIDKTPAKDIKNT